MRERAPELRATADPVALLRDATQVAQAQETEIREHRERFEREQEAPSGTSEAQGRDAPGA